VASDDPSAAVAREVSVSEVKQPWFNSPILPELVPRGCHLSPYETMAVPQFAIKGEFIAYASPESTYAVTKRLLDSAQRSILIGIYDFTADYVRDLLLDAVRRGVQVSLMLDLDNRKGENEIWEELTEAGVEGVPAPSCASEHARYFSSSHEKVIVIDDLWTLVQSGNYSDASIPANEVDGGQPDRFLPGNRDMGVAVKSEELARFFTGVLREDMRLEREATFHELPSLEAVPSEVVPLEASVPPKQPPKRYASRRFRPLGSVSVQPVLSPDNYMDVIPDLLSSARRSIYIEQQYIRGHQSEIQRLLAAIQTAVARYPRLVVRIVLAWPYSPHAQQERLSIEALDAAGFTLGRHVRFLSHEHFVHCHNKLIIVDRKRVLVSSQNWSDAAVTRNREAGLLVDYAPLARYYSALFGVDWRTGRRTFVEPELQGAEPGLEGAVPFEGVPLSLGDYVEV
jgi:phosphatidylserine/phosphatidylglycerophosphate/cardiolipin synthase-like enzyme